MLYPEGQARGRPHVHRVAKVPTTGVKLQEMPVAVLAEQLRVTCVPTTVTVFLGPVTMFCPQTSVDQPFNKTTNTKYGMVNLKISRFRKNWGVKNICEI